MMSDSVTNVQIEDVLSSIRKLVSEEVRAQSRDVRTANVPGLRAGGASASAEDRLLLTPALRVAPANDETARADADTSHEPDPDEAPFTHAETLTQDADLLSLMDRVRAAGAGQPNFESKRPVGIAAVKRPEEEKPEKPTSEEAIRSALFSLGTDTAYFDKFATDDSETTAEDSADLEEDAALSAALDLENDTPDTTALDKQSDDTPNVGETVPKFLHRRGISSLGQRIADVESVVSTSGGDWEPEADEEAEAAPGPQLSTVPWDDADVTASLEASEAAEASDDDWAVAADPKARDFQETPARMASAEAAADEYFLQADNLSDAPDADGDAFADDEISVAVHDAAESLEALQDDDDAQDWEDSIDLHDVPHIDPVADLEEVKPAAAPVEDQFAEDVAEDANDQDVVAAAAPQRETIVQRSTSYESYDRYDQDDRATLADEEETLIDEDVLRDLVAEIVRQELQGALGERITRNVRKLVRREIHRALAAHNLD